LSIGLCADAFDVIGRDCGIVDGIFIDFPVFLFDSVQAFVGAYPKGVFGFCGSCNVFAWGDY
jgi:hypothetical protein